MASPLSECTKEEQRSTIRFLMGEGCKGPEIIQRLRGQYGDKALPRSTVYLWLKHFKNGRTRVPDEGRSGRPVTSTTANNIAAAERLILNDRRVSVMEIAQALDISVGSAYDIIHSG